MDNVQKHNNYDLTVVSPVFDNIQLSKQQVWTVPTFHCKSL
jgi:hypothetical protein